MNEIYVIIEGEYSDWDIVGFVNNEEEAMQICAQHNEKCGYEDWYYCSICRIESPKQRIKLNYVYEICFEREKCGYSMSDYYEFNYYSELSTKNILKPEIVDYPAFAYIIVRVPLKEINLERAKKIAQDTIFVLEVEMKLLQGDCLELMKDIPDGSVDMVLADLPYGTTACKWDTVIPFEPLWEQYHRLVKPNGAIVLFGSEPFSTALRNSNLKEFRYDWIWEKEQGANFMLCKYQPYKVHETMSVFSVERHIYNPQMSAGTPYISGKGTSGDITRNVKKKQTVNTGTRYPRSILRFNTGKAKNVHPTQKPVALLEYLIRTYTNEGETVLDNTMGSGSTGVACVNTNRDFIGIELDEGYFEIAKQRIESAQNKR